MNATDVYEMVGGHIGQLCKRMNVIENEIKEIRKKIDGKEMKKNEL